MLNQEAMTPLYVQLMEEVEKSIQRGDYKPGDRIMTESEMAKTYGVSLITVRKAIGSLTEKGLLVRKQGKGTFVMKPKFSRNMKKLQSFSEMCRQMGVRPGARMLQNRLIKADSKISARLGLAAGSNVIYIERLRFADQEPVQIERNYFPLKYASLLDANFDDNSLLDFLNEHNGMRVAASEKIIELCRATAEEASLLDMKKGDYLLFVRSTAFDQTGEPLYAGVQIINGDRFSLYVYETSGE
ncbi:MAG: GntR family transcriptional regulator [Lachnospiraceae bacterium]|jgi:GntR family transcriptional regulator|nr:GntR family transcriptional regulator [Lachnospiraceae bacterium]